MAADRTDSSRALPACPATFLGAVDVLLGEFVQLTLQHAVSSAPGGNLPIGRLVAVGSDYLAIDRPIVNGVRLRGVNTVWVRQTNVFNVALVNVEEMVVDLALALPETRGRPAGC